MVEAIQKKTSVLATWSLVFGCLFAISLFSFFSFLSLFLSIAALILGIIASVKISKEGNNLRGKGLATGGIVLGVVGILLSIAIILPSLKWARTSGN